MAEHEVVVITVRSHSSRRTAGPSTVSTDSPNLSGASYQPEVVAEAIVWAAHHRRPEVWVGGTTAATILADRVAPRVLDHYLGRTGFDAQQRDEPAEPGRPSKR